MSMGTSTLVRIVFGFLSISIAARIIPQEDFGVYFLLLAIVYFLEMITDAGLRLSAAKFIASAPNDDERQAIVNNLLTFRILTLLVISFLAYISKPFILSFYPSDLLDSLFIYVPIVFCVQLTESTLTYMMQGFHLYKQMAFLQVATSALNLLLMIIFLLVLNWGVEGFVLAYITSLLVVALVRVWAIPTPKRLAFEPKLIRRIIKFGLPLQGNDILTFMFNRVDVFLLGALMGPLQIAYLEIAGKIPHNFGRLYQALQSVYFPNMAELFAQDRRLEAEVIMNNFLRIAAFVTMFLTMVFILFQDAIIVLVFSDKYLISGPAMSLLMIMVSVSVASTILDTSLIAIDRPVYLLVINSVTAVVSVVANIVLIPRFGFMGAVYASLIATCASYPVSLWGVYREKIRVNPFEYLKPAFILGICSIIYIWVDWDTLFFKGLLLFLFLILSFGFSIITNRDIQALYIGLRISTQRTPAEG